MQLECYELIAVFSNGKHTVSLVIKFVVLSETVLAFRFFPFIIIIMVMMMMIDDTSGFALLF